MNNFGDNSSRPPVELLWEKYSYNPLTGRFYRRVDDLELVGNIVGTSSRTHQLSVSRDHRYPYGVCVFAWINGRWPMPGLVISHRNRNSFDHRCWNLVEVSRGRTRITRKNVTCIQPKDLHGGRKRDSLVGLPDVLRRSLATVDSLNMLSGEKKKTESVLIDCTPEQRSAVISMGWTLIGNGSSRVVCEKPTERRRRAATSRFYAAAILALKIQPIHLGDLAMLWLAIVPEKVTKPSIHIMMYNLSRISGFSIIKEAAFVNLGSATLPGCIQNPIHHTFRPYI